MLFLIITLGFLFSPVTALADTASPNIEIVSAAVTAQSSINGTSNATVNGDTIEVSLGTMTMPGACAVISVDLVNSGNQTAQLSLTQYMNCECEWMKVDFPDIKKGEMLAPNEHCHFDIVVSWDKDCTGNTDISAEPFGIHLVYTADNALSVKRNTSMTSPKTGTEATFLMLALGAIILGAVLLLTVQRESRKHERAIQKQNDTH